MQSPLTIKRIFKDIKELSETKLVGIAACIPDETNILKVHANILIQEGLYKSLLIPIILVLPKDYPLSPPAAFVVGKHPFNNKFHEHVIQRYGDSDERCSICTDLTSNFASFFQEEKGSGWTPAYTIQSVLIQLQTFLAKPDLPKILLPSISQINKMLEDAKAFVHSIKKTENGNTTLKLSSFQDPYPFVDTKSLDEFQQAIKDERVENEAGELNKEEKNYMEERARKIEISNKLICPIIKMEYGEANEIQFGYPILVHVDKFERLQTTPVIEIISKEGLEYFKQAQKSVHNEELRIETWKSIFGFEFNHWFPIYINKHHFEKIKDHLLMLICDLLKVPRNWFRPSDVLKLIPPLLVKTSINFIKGELYQSFAAIDAYCQFQFLLMKLIQLYPDIQKEINEQVNVFLTNRQKRHKREAGDLGEFMIKASLSDKGFNNVEIKYAIFFEFLTRQVSWVAKEDEDIQLNLEKTPNLVKRFFSKGKVAREFFILQNESAKLLVNDKVLKEMESRSGFISDETAHLFRKKLGECQKNVEKDWTIFVGMLGLNDKIKNEREMNNILVNAIVDAKQKYGNEIFSKRHRNDNTNECDSEKRQKRW